MKIFDLVDEMINRIPESVINVLNFFAMLFTIAAGVGIPTSIFTIFVGHVDSKSDVYNIPSGVFIGSLSIVLILLMVRYYLLKFRTVKNYRQVSERYYRLLHDFRNDINQLELYYKDIECGKKWDMDLFTVMVSQFLINGLDNLCETLQILSGGGKKICGCVKYLYTNETGKISYYNALVKTFVRSSNTDSNRIVLDEKNINKPIKVSENTDFRTIINGDQNCNNDVFYKQNLIKYDKQLNKADPNAHYDNTTEHYEQYYIATIVAPIRVANKRLFYKKENTDYDLLGFLCVDTLDGNLFTRRQRETFTYLVKAYASVFYNIMSKYQYYMIKFAEYEKTLKVNGQSSQNQLQESRSGKGGRNRKKSNRRK